MAGYIFMHDDTQVYDIDIDDRYVITVPIEHNKTGKVYAQHGKILYGKGDYQGALDAYSVAIAYYVDKEFLARMLCNRAMVHLKKGNAYFAYIDASEALKLVSTLYKAYYRQGKALIYLGFYSSAQKSFKECLKLAPAELEVAKELTAIENKEYEPKVDPKKLKDYDPFDADSPKFGRENLTGMVNRYNNLVSATIQDIKDKAKLKFDIEKIDEDGEWSSGEALLECLFDSACWDIGVGAYEDGAMWLKWAIAMDYNSVVALFHNEPPMVKYGPNPGLLLLHAECCLRTGKLYNAVESAFLALNMFNIYHSLVMEIWDKPPGAMWPFYSTLIADFILVQVAIKAGHYSLADKIFKKVDDEIRKHGRKIWGTRFDLPYVEKLEKFAKKLAEELKNKKSDSKAYQDVKDFLNYRLGIMPKGAHTMVHKPTGLKQGQLCKDPFSGWNETEMEKLQFKLYYERKAAFCSLFPIPYAFIDAELKVLEEDGMGGKPKTKTLNKTSPNAMSTVKLSKKTAKKKAKQAKKPKVKS